MFYEFKKRSKMNANNLTLIFCAIIACCFVHYARCGNANRTSGSTLAATISIERITELYLTLIDLMEQFKRDVIPHYSKFFDAALLRKARYVFSQLYNYARNETQGIEWEKTAAKFFQLYVIHISAAQANAHYEYYTEFVDKKVGEPCSLRVTCLSLLMQQIRWQLKNNSRHFLLYDQMLEYEMLEFTALPVSVSTINTPPFLIIRLNKNYDRERFIDEAELSGAVVVSQRNITQNTYRFPVPFSPEENFANELEIFRRAQSSVFFIVKNCLSDSEMSVYVHTGVNAHINKFLQNYISNRTNVGRRSGIQACCLRRCALLIIFYTFLQDEYHRLICHPVYRTISGSASGRGSGDIKTFIHYRQRHLKIFYESLTGDISARGIASELCGLVERLYKLLRRLNFIVGYSLQRNAGIVAVENSA